MITPDLNNPFWQYSLKVYAQPGVADTCLQLQDQYGCNVNLLLLAAWAASQGFQLSPSDFVELQERISELDQQTIQPLRSLRRQVSQQLALPQEWQTDLKQRLLSAELLAEQMEQALLYHASLPFLKKEGNTSSSSVQDNLRAYISAVSDILPTMIASNTAGASQDRSWEFPVSSVLPRMLPFPVMDTSTGSLTLCPTADLYKEQKFCTTNQTGFTHRWLQALRPSFSVQPPTNCQGSVPFPEFALFTTLPGRVRLSQSGQRLADILIVV